MVDELRGYCATLLASRRASGPRQHLFAKLDLRLRHHRIMERTARFDELIEEAQAYLRGCQAELDIEYRLWHWPRYDWYQETQQLIFSENGVAKVVADIQFVGSISTQSDTWLWAWANDSVDPRLSTSMSVVRKFGEEHGFDHLISKQWHAHEVDGWEMASIAAFLLKARGAYRTPKETGFTFMIMTDVRWAT
jgi:hypothetical protein